MTSKNASPSGAWLIIAMVYRGVSTPAASSCAPPLLLHAAVTSTTAAATPATPPRLREPNIVVLSSRRAFVQAIPVVIGGGLPHLRPPAPPRLATVREPEG